MRQIGTIVLFAFLSLAPSMLLAETALVLERKSFPLQESAIEGSVILKTIESGTSLEVLEHSGTYARVRDPQGIEGWISARYLIPPPGLKQVADLEVELAKLRAQLEQARKQLANSSPTRETDKLEAELHKVRAHLTQTEAQLQKAQTELAKQSTQKLSPTDKPNNSANTSSGSTDTPLNAQSGFGFIWLIVGFAMLVIGFVGGTIWVRESIRRRSGGMYLRI